MVLAITSIIGVSSAPFLSRFIRQNAVSNTRDSIISTMRKAQSYAIAGKDNSAWKVDIDSNKIRLIRASDNTVFDNNDYGSNTSISGLDPITFTRPIGIPDITENITVSGGNTTNNITVNSQGVASY